MNKKVGLVVFLWVFVVGLLILRPSVSVTPSNANGLLDTMFMPGQYSTELEKVLLGEIPPSNLDEFGSFDQVFNLDYATNGELFTLTSEFGSEDINFSTFPFTELEIWAPYPALDTDILHWVDLPDNDFGWVLVGNQTPHQIARRLYSKDKDSHAYCPSQGSEYFRSFITDSG